MQASNDSRQNRPAALTASLVRRTYYSGANIVAFPKRAARERQVTRTLAPFRAILRSSETRLFISVSSSAFVFVLGFIG
jgi:hypothetical protein